MASQQTPNYKLSRWAGTDRVLVEEFNDNWDKIDAALAARNCRVYTEHYLGNDEKTRTFEFPGKPVFVLIIGNNCFSILNRDMELGYSLWSLQTQRDFSTAWGEKSVTLSTPHTSVEICNIPNKEYGLFAILEVD